MCGCSVSLSAATTVKAACLMQVEDKYDPAFPNDYEEYCKQRTASKRAEHADSQSRKRHEGACCHCTQKVTLYSSTLSQVSPKIRNS